MGKAKEIEVKIISSANARNLIKKYHYSGKIVNNSQLHFGVFLGGICGGALQFGPSLDKRKMLSLVEGTKWNEFLELNRMAFADWLPKNSESRAIAFSLRYIKKNYPHIKWIVSFSDGTQCGDGTIYRASGFSLTAINKNKTLLQFPNGEIISDMGLKFSKDSQLRLLGGTYLATACLRKAKELGAIPLLGFQFRYLYFLKQNEINNLTVPIIPFSKIAEIGAGMYKGKTRASSLKVKQPLIQREEGGAIPTDALQLNLANAKT